MNRILKINILIVIILFLLTTVCQALNATVSTNTSNVKIGEEFKLIITFDEKVVAINFDINYDNEAFEFVKGDNINAAEKDGRIVCIYADSALIGTNSFSLTFKAIKEGNNSAFGVDNAKIRVNGQEVSNNGEDVDGLYCIRSVEVIKEDNIDDSKENNNTKENKRESYSNTITNNNTQAEKIIPKAGFNYTIFIIIIMATAFCVISKIKFNNINKILPVIIFASVLWINSSVFASNEDIVVKEYNNLIENEKVFTVMLPNDTENLYITATELEDIIKEKFDYTITSITQDDKTTLVSTNKINTGAQININGEKYIALIYGDANGDGTVCDIDDLMIIIKDFLGIRTVTGIYRLAADLANQDNLNILDSDDLMQMIRMYLGRLTENLVQVLPSEKEIIVHINDESNNMNDGGGYIWKYNIYSDGTVIGEKWTSGSILGFVSEKIKEYTITLTLEELEFLKNIENKYVKGIIPENIITNIDIENKNGTEIYTTMLTIPDFNTLKSIIEKITEFREEIILKYADYTMVDFFDNIDYSIDIYSKKIVCNIVRGGAINLPILNYIKQTEKTLTEGQITKIKDLYKKIEKNSSQYETKPADLFKGFYEVYITNIGKWYIYLKEDLQIIESIVSNMKELDGIEARINYNVSQNCTTSLEMDDGTNKTIELGEKGYKFIETSDGYYMVITMGLKTGTENRIIVEDININNNQITVFAKEKIQTEIVSDVIEYPYSIIKFNKKPEKITLDVIDGEGYKEILEPIDVKKPIIYLYPQKETEVTVKVGKPEKLTCTYPKYADGWEVVAKPSGDLIDCKTGRNLYCLYWEGINTVKSNLTEGFIVKGENVSKFLEEKLAILGLNSKETNEFIIYWLPQLEKNNYNFIRFQTTKEINENMPLEVLPIPDTVIRVMMEWKALENPINIKEQKLEKMARSGFSVIEWGGTEIK